MKALFLGSVLEQAVEEIGDEVVELQDVENKVEPVHWKLLEPG